MGGGRGEWRRRQNQGTDTCERVFAGKTNTFLYSLHGSLILVPARILNARELIRRVSFFQSTDKISTIDKSGMEINGMGYSMRGGYMHRYNIVASVSNKLDGINLEL